MANNTNRSGDDMSTLIIIILVICTPIYALVIYGLIRDYISDKKKKRDSDFSWKILGSALIAPLFLLYISKSHLGACLELSI